MRDWGDDFTLIEAKAAAGGLPENLPETICAFANMPQGGTVFLGVDQRTNFEAVGVSEPPEMVQGLLSQARNMEAGYVVRDGGQGNRSTRYRRIKP
ncbi:Divergent AAA domain protein [Corynebacterium oculi]|uniref:Divergent AAA domain protein n=2 Tax=Corynebacterium oculi TaxID=1544416 RepID=A0A0N8VZN5_9CORY|nr:Divergent AAA domain protein [Corynebacterium oculi]